MSYSLDIVDGYEALKIGAGLVPLSNKEVVAVTGKDRLTWLTTLSSQIVDDITPGKSKELLLLDANGHISFAAGIIDTGSLTYLLVDTGYAEKLLIFLESMRFRLRVEVTQIKDFALYGFIRGGAIEKALPTSVFVWNDPWPGICQGGTTYCEVPYPHIYPMSIALVHAADKKEIIEEWVRCAKEYEDFPQETTDGYVINSPRCCDEKTWEAIRLHNWRPSLACEGDSRSVPHEYDWLRTAVHLHKGCYCGQETVARIVNLGRPPRRLVFVNIDGSTGKRPLAGAKLVYGSRSMGKLTSVCYHPEEGWIGLGLVKRAAPEGDAMLEWVDDKGGSVKVAAAITPIVSPRGKCHESPKVRPGQGVKRLPGASQSYGQGFGIGRL